MMQTKKKKKQYANALWTIMLPLVVFCALGVFFAIERTGISVTKEAADAAYLPRETLIPRVERRPEVRCLVIDNTEQAERHGMIDNLLFVLDQMSIGHTLVDIADRNIVFPPLSDYTTIIIACEELRLLYFILEDIMDWVKAGGGLLFANTPEDEVLTRVFYREMGVEKAIDYSFVPQLKATLVTDIMAGGKGAVLDWSDPSLEGFRSGYNFRLDDTCNVHMRSEGPEGPTAMLWDHAVGNGRIVVNNNDAMAEIWSRGLVAAAVSLTERAVAWPVINASVFFIDDFPSPIAEGFDLYLSRDYGVQTEYFFVHIWFPDMLRLADKYKIKYSSVFIETYEDHVEPPFEPAPPQIAERFKYFGSLFLNEGHEIGLHGFNHQSLVLPNFDYRDELPYNKWPSEANITEALNETVRLQEELFPGNIMRTYVPPSNVLSAEARALLRRNFPDLSVISGLLVDDIFNLRSEFGVAGDGFIDFPRISSGFDPLDADNDEQPFWAILSEINLHFVNSHFIHPDDPMDPDRGALKGWKRLSESFDDFLEWLDRYPMRNLTSQEAAPAVQRFENLSVRSRLTRDEAGVNTMTLNLDGFIDEAYLLVRFNDGVPGAAEGGSLTLVSENLYLLKADKNQVTVHFEVPEE